MPGIHEDAGGEGGGVSGPGEKHEGARGAQGGEARA